VTGEPPAAQFAYLQEAEEEKGQADAAANEKELVLVGKDGLRRLVLGLLCILGLPGLRCLGLFFLLFFLDLFDRLVENNAMLAEFGGMKAIPYTSTED
jgi:hypothetical protein